MKKVLAFDLDETLNVAKTPMEPEIAEVFMKLLDHYPMCVISGQKYDQFLLQVVDTLPNPTEKQLENLHLMVTQGGRYYRREQGEWRLVYNYDLTPEQVAKISEALETAAKELGYWEANPAGEIVENRLSQVSLSALGQHALPEDKYKWDPDMKKRNAIAVRAKELAPEFEYEVGGTTTINVNVPGMNKLMEQLGVNKEDILFFGDMVQPGGNDYPVVQMGIDTIAVKKWQDTMFALRGILGVS
jgi:phosphomannomutase